MSKNSLGSKFARKPRITLGSVAVGVVLFFSFLIFAANVRIAPEDDITRPTNLPQLIEQENERADNLSSEYEALSQQIEQLQEELNFSPLQDAGIETEELQKSAALEAVSGPGVRVSLTDAPQSMNVNVSNPNDLLIHEEDIQAVLNALWAGKAEAVTVAGHRVSATTKIRCAGNILFIAGRRYSPPFVIEAIGDQDRLNTALATSPEILKILSYHEQFGLGWEQENLDNVEMPSAGGSHRFQYAKPILEEI